MSHEEEFLKELNIFRNEIDSALKSLYTELAIHQIAVDDKKILNALNLTPTFWNTVLNGLQHSTFIIIGRILGISKHNIWSLYTITKNNKNIFTKESFERRFLKDNKDINKSEKWYSEYIKNIYVPSDSDFTKLKIFTEKQIKLYIKIYRPVRDHFGHKTHIYNQDIKVLFDAINIKDIEKFCIQLKGLHEALWQLYHNGRGPFLPIKLGRYSTKNIIKNGYKEYHSMPINAQVIEEVVRVLKLLKNAT